MTATALAEPTAVCPEPRSHERLWHGSEKYWLLGCPKSSGQWCGWCGGRIEQQPEEAPDGR